MISEVCFVGIGWLLVWFLFDCCVCWVVMVVVVGDFV